MTWSGLPCPFDPSTSSPRCSRAKSGPSARRAASPPPGRSGRAGCPRPAPSPRRARCGSACRLDRGTVVVDPLPRPQLLQLQRIAEPPDQRRQDREQLLQARRPEHPQRRLALGQVVRFEQPWQPQDVVGVVVRQVDLVDLRQPQRPLHLPLRAFATVKQQPVPAPRDQHAAVERRAEGAEAPVPRNVDLEVHEPASLREVDWPFLRP